MKNMLAGKGVLVGVDEVIRGGEGTNRVGQDF